MIEVGQTAPDFTLPGIQDGEKRDYTLSEFRGRKVVLAFYPGDFTPGCTRQMCSYRDNFDELDPDRRSVARHLAAESRQATTSGSRRRGFRSRCSPTPRRR